MKAALLTLKAVCGDFSGVTISLRVDNTSADAAISNMGSESLVCDAVIREIWDWEAQSGNWLVTSNIAGVDNVVADAESRKKHKHNIGWSLTKTVFEEAVTRLRC